MNCIEYRNLKTIGELGDLLCEHEVNVANVNGTFCKIAHYVNPETDVCEDLVFVKYDTGDSVFSIPNDTKINVDLAGVMNSIMVVELLEEGGITLTIKPEEISFAEGSIA